eukprot:jgi/Botrbrau1/9197/Bobra.0236s0024.2
MQSQAAVLRRQRPAKRRRIPDAGQGTSQRSRASQASVGRHQAPPDIVDLTVDDSPKANDNGARGGPSGARACSLGVPTFEVKSPDRGTAPAVPKCPVCLETITDMACGPCGCGPCGCLNCLEIIICACLCFL